MHTHAHEAWNERIQREHGHPMAAIDDMIAKSLKRMKRWMSPLNQLAFTVCLEHFTSGFGHLLLDSAAGKETLAQAAEPQRSLWVWHAVEELEHKCVAIDVYNAMGGGYLRRAGDCGASLDSPELILAPPPRLQGAVVTLTLSASSRSRSRP
jgi:predicted metal-dependent hydrolase